MEKRRWGKILFWAYVILMLWLLFGQRIGSPKAASYQEYFEKVPNMVPLKTIRHYWDMAMNPEDWSDLVEAAINLLGNVVMFVPLGFFLPLNWEKCRGGVRWLLWATGIVVLIECTQMVTLLGYLDVDDLILNLAGAGLGYWIWRFTDRKWG